MLVYNLIRSIMLKAARSQKVNVNRLSFANPLGAVPFSLSLLFQFENSLGEAGRKLRADFCTGCGTFRASAECPNSPACGCTACDEADLLHCLGQ
jgi:hypothetical protein